MTEDIPRTGPEAILHKLKTIDLEALEAEQREVIKSKKKTKRSRAVRLINTIQGLRKNNLRPEDTMINSVPVIPPAFRPFSITGDTFLPGDSNEVYRDVSDYRKIYEQTEKSLGRSNAGEAYVDMVKAVRAAYGYGDSPNPKTKARAVKGFFKQVTGTSPKYSYYQRRMLAKPVDFTGRGVIIPDAEFGIDEVGMPIEMGYSLFAPHVQRRLVRSGMSPADALRHLKNRTPQAEKMLHDEAKDRPVIVTRAPSWHKQNVVGQYAKFVPGDAIRINTFIAEGMNADYDGDQSNIHVPATPEAVKETKEKMMASKMLFSIKDREKTLPAPKHEQIIGLSLASSRKGAKHKFRTEEEAMKAIDEGAVSLRDDIEIG